LLSNDAGSWCKKEEQLRRILDVYPPDVPERCGLAIVCTSYTLTLSWKAHLSIARDMFVEFETVERFNAPEG
jgi:hypothetical protein